MKPSTSCQQSLDVQSGGENEVQGVRLANMILSWDRLNVAPA